MQSLLILGRQPALGLAELESLYGAAKLQPVGDKAVIVDIDPCLLAFDRLGGSLKFCKILTTLDTTDWKKIEQFLISVAPGHSQTMPAGKMLIGLSVIGLDIGLRQLEATGLTVKKAIRQTGRSVRLVPNKSQELNSAQIIHNKLTGSNGWELVFISDGHKTIVAQTVKVQDIESYTRRDRLRPFRDTKVGMLPPKLAQIIINLSVGLLPQDKLSSICDIPAGQAIPRPILGKTIADPFCGTGVVLQEALLMGYEVVGSDLEPRMLDYSTRNLVWLANNFGIDPVDNVVTAGDATNYRWPSSFDFVASETYLGRPFTARPSPEILNQTAGECNLILRKFLQNISSQIISGTRLCLAVPAWQNGYNRFKTLPLIDCLGELGYNRISFEHSGNDDLIYHRTGQIVARQLLILTKQ